MEHGASSLGRFFLGERALGTRWIGSRVGPRAGLTTCRNSKCETKSQNNERLYVVIFKNLSA
jgi:hypothetical protein